MLYIQSDLSGLRALYPVCDGQLSPKVACVKVSATRVNVCVCEVYLLRVPLQIFYSQSNSSSRYRVNPLSKVSCVKIIR